MVLAILAVAKTIQKIKLKECQSCTTILKILWSSNRL
jgi:hypothetical protein